MRERNRWAALAVSLWVAFVGVVIVVGSCSIEKKSDEFTTCDNTADCSNGQTCSGGVCVDPTTLPDAPGNNNPEAGPSCPAQCTSCRTVNGQRECIVDCAVSAPLCNAKITCPQGFDCNIRCTTQSACQKGIECNDEQDCTIECSGRAACRDVSCGDGRCRVTCTGEQSCEDIACNQSCACDVACSLGSRCLNVVCTLPQCSGGGLNRCSSLLVPACDTCP